MTVSAAAALSAGEPERPGEIGTGLVQRWDHDQERDHGEILEQQHAHDVAAVRRPELHALGQHLRHDGRGAHCQRAAQHQTGLPAVAHEVQRDHRDRVGDGDLREAKPEYRAAHRPQLRQAELESDREHEKNHAELADVARRVVVGHPRKRVRSHRDAYHQIADDRRQPQQPAGDHDDDGRRQQRDDQD